MAANPLGPQQVQPMAPVQHAQFQPSATEQMGSQLLSAGVSKGATHLGNAMFPAAAQTAATGAAATGAAATGAAATGAAATGAAATGAAATGAAGAGGMAGMLGGLGAGGAGLMAAAAPIALPLAIGAGLGKMFGLFNEGGMVPEETMTAMSPQQQAPQQQTPLSFKQLEQQQSLILKKKAFDADERRKEEAHQIKMAQQQIKLSEAAGLRTPLSAP